LEESPLLLEEFFPTFTQFFFQRRAVSKNPQYHRKKGVQCASFEKEKQQDIIISVQNTKIVTYSFSFIVVIYAPYFIQF
jgi:hypothetical protein